MKKSITCLMFTLGAGAAFGEPNLASLNRSDEVFNIRKTAEGKAVSVLGRFNLSLARNEFEKKGVVEQALKRFVEGSREDFGLEENESVKFRIQETVVLNDETVVVHLDQMVGSLRVMDQPLSAVFSKDGMLIALHGVMVSNHAGNGRSAIARPSLSDVEVQAILSEHSGYEHTSRLTGSSDFRIAGEHLYRRDDTAEIEAGWSMQLGGIVWQARLPTEEFVIDDASGLVVMAGSSENEVVRTCRVRTRPFPINPTTMRVSSMVPSAGSVNRNQTCQANVNWFTNMCTWQLRREEGLAQHQMRRVDDWDGGETSDIQSCSSSSVPQFNDFREEQAFYTESNMRTFIKQNVWDNNAPVQTANVQTQTDNAALFSARFSPFCAVTGTCPTIACNTAAVAWGVDGACTSDVLSHEYGHYVHWSLGHQGDHSCTSGVNEGGSLNETFANSFAMITWLDDPRSSNMEYSAGGGAAAGNIPAPHTNISTFRLIFGQWTQVLIPDGSLRTTGANPASCTGGPSNDGFNDPSPGLHFNQALWEILFNRNCQSEFCNSSLDFGSSIWLTQNQEQVINRVGDALGWAIKVTSSFVSHQAIIDMFVIKINSNSGYATAQRVGDIFQHHGFTSPI